MKFLRFLNYKQKRKLDSLSIPQLVRSTQSSAFIEYRQNALETSEKIAGDVVRIRDFTQELKKAWQEHNNHALILDEFLCRLAQSRSEILTIEKILWLKNIFRIVFEVERKKFIYSLAIKKVLDSVLERLKRRYYFFDVHDISLLLTSSQGTFWTTYHTQHQQWIVNKRLKRAKYPSITADFLFQQYHLLDEDLFKIRLEKFVDQYKVSISELIRRIEESLQFDRLHWIHKFYLTIERPDLREFDELLMFDNVTEPLYRCQWWGMPDFLFRRYVVLLLNTYKLLGRGQNFFEYSLGEVLEAFDGLLKQVRKYKKCTIDFSEVVSI